MPPATTPANGTNTSGKVLRLATACNLCRSYKIKCDTGQPACSNCRRRGVECVTTDLRKGGSAGQRVEPVGREGRTYRNRPPRNRSNPSTQSQAVSISLSTPQIQDAGLFSWSSNGSPSFKGGSEPSQSIIGARARDSGVSSNSTSEKAIFSLPFNLNDQDHERGNPTGTGTISSNTFPSSRNVAENSSRHDDETSGGMDLTMLTDESPGRLQMMGISSSLYILIQWLDLFFNQRPSWEPIFPHFQQGMAYTVEMPLPFPVSLPPMPQDLAREDFVSIFTRKILPAYPLLDLDAFWVSVKSVDSKMNGNSGSLSSADYPSLACAYALFSISADEKEGRVTADGTTYLEAAYFLHAHLLATPYVESVQALLLLTIALRGRNKDGASWGILGQAIRMAQSIGLHRYIAPSSSLRGPPAVAAAKKADLHSRVWWIAYCLERMMELETGRPSAIQDSECDQALPRFLPKSLDGSRFDYLEALIGLAKLQTQISDRLYRKKSVKRTTERLLQDCGMLDRALLQWADSLPEGVRPGRDIFWDPDQFQFATFLSLHFHQTMIALHRPALMSRSEQLRQRVELHCSGTPWRFRLRYSMCICAASARSIVKATNDLVYNGVQTRLITITPVMLATVVLAIYITKTQYCGLNDSDLALLVNCSMYAEQEYIQMGQDPEFIKVCTIIRSQLSDHVRALKLEYQATTPSAGPFTPMSIPQQLHTNKETDSDSFENEYFGGTEFDELWPYLWGDDLNQVYVGNAESTILNTHLLGLPISGVELRHSSETST